MHHQHHTILESRPANHVLSPGFFAARPSSEHSIEMSPIVGPALHITGHGIDGEVWEDECVECGRMNLHKM